MSRSAACGLLEIDGCRIVDAHRMRGYMSSPVPADRPLNYARPHPGWTWRGDDCPNCLCDEDACLDAEGEPIQYSYPADPANPAPWYDANRQSTGEFFGLNVISIRRSGGYALNTTPGDIRPSFRSDTKQFLVITADLVAASCEGVQAGEDWLNRLFSKPCGKGFDVVWREHCDREQGMVEVEVCDEDGNPIVELFDRMPDYGKRIMRDAQLVGKIECLEGFSQGDGGGRVQIVLESRYTKAHRLANLVGYFPSTPPIAAAVLPDPEPIPAASYTVNSPQPRVDRNIRLRRDRTWCDVDPNFDTDLCHRLVVTEWEEFEPPVDPNIYCIVVWYNGLNGACDFSWSPVNPTQDLTCDMTVEITQMYVRNKDYNPTHPDCTGGVDFGCAQQAGIPIGNGPLGDFLDLGAIGDPISSYNGIVDPPINTGTAAQSALLSALRDYSTCIDGPSIPFDFGPSGLGSDFSAQRVRVVLNTETDCYELWVVNWTAVQVGEDDDGNPIFVLGNRTFQLIDLPGMCRTGTEAPDCTDDGCGDRECDEKCYEWTPVSPSGGPTTFVLDLEDSPTPLSEGDYSASPSWTVNPTTKEDLCWELTNGTLFPNIQAVCTVVSQPCNQALDVEVDDDGMWEAIGWAVDPLASFPPAGTVGFNITPEEPTEPCEKEVEVTLPEGEPECDVCRPKLCTGEHRPKPYRKRRGCWLPLEEADCYSETFALSSRCAEHDMQLILQGMPDYSLFEIYNLVSGETSPEWYQENGCRVDRGEIWGAHSNSVINLDGTTGTASHCCDSGGCGPHTEAAPVRGERGRMRRVDSLAAGAYIMFVWVPVGAVGWGVQVYNHELVP